ncbi:6-phospho-beta-glucosidase (plasmid) [Chloroflexota bacterium]|nr:6-phospho-beta-glucosidase [Chloroflexota bacterium]
MLKVTVIGGGSTYTPELLNGFIEREADFPLDELWLMDIDSDRLAVVGGFAQRMAEARQASFKVILSTDQKEAIRDASYVITQLRVGQMAARREDEYLGRRHSLIGQETTGVGGMAKALRTIPVVLDVARDIEEVAPGALLVNFANPSGLVTEALFRYAPDVESMGVCNVSLTTKMAFLEKIEAALGEKVDPQQARLKVLGLNHLTWFYGFEVNGQDLWPQIMDGILAEAGDPEEIPFDRDTLQSLQMLPNYYLKYYYYTKEMLVEQEKWPPSRAEEVLQIEADLLAQYRDPARTEPPADLMKRGGAYYSTVATQLLNAHYNDLDEVHVVDVRHNGAVAGWDPDWVLELPCRVNARGIQPLSADPLPPVCSGLIAQVKAYEILIAQAAVTGDRNTAYQALLAHPLGPAADQVSAVLDDLLETNQPYLPAFFK